jgi:hypothetical protein
MLHSWILVVYLSTFVGDSSTGGPAAVPGFASLEDCKATGERFRSVPKFDWYVCVGADLPPAGTVVLPMIPAPSASAPVASKK